LDYEPATLQLIEELGVTRQLIEASRSANRRYIQVKGKLLAIPMDPVNFIRTSLISSKDKWSLLGGLFKKNIATDNSIYNYVSQRFSRGIAESLVDPFISGIYAGDIKRLHMAEAFPKFKRRGSKRKIRMCSFNQGMGQVIDEMGHRYRENIQTNVEARDWEALRSVSDVIIIAAPAYAAASIVETVNPGLARVLEKIPYAPVAVAGLAFKNDDLKMKPDGFGYLIPSGENKDVLGVLLESNVYVKRSKDNEMMMRVILGGAHHPQIINDTPEQIVDKAIKEIDTVYGLKSQPVATFVKIWPKAIPQYEMDYPYWRKAIAKQSLQTRGLYLCANYLDGISFNDCINNAKSLALKIVQC
jgi:oxygen-dependent protoporphyrinogen oxidase